MKRLPRVVFIGLRVLIGLGLVFHLSTSGAIRWPMLWGLVSVWPVALVILSLILIAMGLLAWRLCVLLKPSHLHLSWFASIRLTLIGAFFNVCLPGGTGGDIVKIYYATEGNRGRRTEVATIMLFERAIGLFTLLLLPLLMAPFFLHLLGSLGMLRHLLWSIAALVAVMLGGLLACASSGVRQNRLVSWVFRKLPLGSYMERVFDTVYTYRRHLPSLCIAIGISLLVHVINVAVILLIAQAITPTGAAWRMSLLIPIGFMANFLPITPGGLGVGETAFHRLFTLVGLTGGADTLLAWRLLNVLIDFLGFLSYVLGRHPFIQARSFPQGISMTSRAGVG